MLILGKKISLGTFNYSDSKDFSFPVRYIYPKDLNRDGVDEIIFAGFETQPNTPQNYTNTNVNIFNFVNGKYSNATSVWLPNKIYQVQGVGDIAFGDFNNDGRLDFYTSANADMDFSVHQYAFISNGNQFYRVDLGLSRWEHGVSSYDINNDGYSDVLISGYLNPVPIFLGSSSGLVKQYLTDSGGNYSWAGNGSDIVAGNFLNSETISICVVDAGAYSGNTILFTPTFASDSVVVNEVITNLPLPILGDKSHDVRVRAFDFSRDGLSDLLVFSREQFNGAKWPENTRVQFLKNLGGGSFIDVTSTTLVNFSSDRNISYNPVFADINGDGLFDIFLGESDFSVSNSTSILIQKPDGTFVDSYRELLSKVVPSGGIASLAKSPDGFQLIVETTSTGGKATVSSYQINCTDKYGSSGDDNLTGSKYSDELYGYQGNDILDAGDGNDTLVSGAGNDRLKGGNGNDIFVLDHYGTKTITDLGNGIDVIKVLPANSFEAYTVINATLSKAWTATSSTFNLQPTAGVNIQTNRLSVNLSAVTGSGVHAEDVGLPSDYDLTEYFHGFTVTNNGNSKAVTLVGSAFGDSITGGSGADKISGGLGNDLLTGGTGKDIFTFDKAYNALTNVDTITDFLGGTDKINLSKAVFTGLGAKAGKLTDAQFAYATDNLAATDRVIYNSTTGALYYDADGNGSGAAVQIALLGVDSHPNVTFSDFTII